MKNHAKENTELQKQREEERNPPPPGPDSLAENIQVDNSGESNILVIFGIS